MHSIINKILFFTGAVSIFLIPTFKGFNLAHFGIILSFVFLFFVFTSKKTRLYREEFYFIFLGLMFYACSMIGAYNTDAMNGVITSQIFLLIFFVCFISHKNNFIISLVNGFICCAFITAIFIIIDDINYYVLKSFTPLIYKIFPQALAEVNNGGHTYDNVSSLLGALIYRPCGFSWDPGLSVTALALGFVLYNERIGKYKVTFLGNLILILGILLSLSKTSILAVLVYLTCKLFGISKLNVYKKKLLLFLVLFEVLCFFLIGNFITYSGYGNQRHLKYFSSLVYVFGSNPFHFLFGYGFTNPGKFFDLYVPWLNETGYRLAGTSCESTLTNVFLIGGFLGCFYWVYGFYLVWKKNNTKYLFPLLIIIIIGFGYSISSSWFYLMFNSLVLLSLDNKEGEPKIEYNN